MQQQQLSLREEPHRGLGPLDATTVPRWARVIGRVVSGGEEGVDRAALDAALARGVEVGGRCLATERYPARAAMNIHQADATLILTTGTLDNRSRQAIETAEQMGKPYVVISLRAASAMVQALTWLADVRPRVLNIAGPRESRCPGIYAMAFGFLARLLAPSPARLN